MAQELTDRMSQSSGVEVRSISGGWKPGAYIYDYNPDAQTLTVGFENDFSRTEELPIGDVRFEPEVSNEECVYNDSDDVEILWGRNEDAELQWLSAKVRTIKGGFYVCEFAHFGSAQNDVFEQKYLRLPNPNPSLSVPDFHKKELDIPEELDHFCKMHPDAHREFQKSAEAISIRYVSNSSNNETEQKNGKLIILSRKDVSRRVDMIKEFHIKNLQKKMRLAERVTQAQRDLEASKMVAESCCEKFSVDSDLLKFVVGTRGANIHKAREIKGVLDIQIDDENNMVAIYGETPEAARQAKELLEFREDHCCVPRNLVSRIIGQKGKSIQDMIDKSQVLKVRILSDEDAKSCGATGADDQEMTVFKFIGTRQNNNNARALMDYLVQSLKEIDELQEERTQIEKQIEVYKFGSSMNGNLTSGYNSDSSHHRGGGGGGRGQRRGGPRAHNGGGRRGIYDGNRTASDVSVQSDSGSDNIKFGNDRKYRNQRNNRNQQNDEKKNISPKVSPKQNLNNNRLEAVVPKSVEQNIDGQTFENSDWATDPTNPNGDSEVKLENNEKVVTPKGYAKVAAAASKNVPSKGAGDGKEQRAPRNRGGAGNNTSSGVGGGGGGGSGAPRRVKTETK